MLLERKSAWAMVLLLALGGLAACADGADERAALEQEELQRDLELALQGDTLPATFEDTLVGLQPEAEAGPPPTAPAVTRPRAEPSPRPRTEAPRPEAPRPEPREREPDVRPQPRTVTYPVPSGTTFAVRLTETLSTETNAPGDPFTATLSDPIVAGDGSTLIPTGATVRGRVTKVAKSGRVGETAVITVAFESITFGGETYPLQATVVEANPERRTRTSTKETVGKVAAGAAAGAILGQVLGKNTESTVKGAVVGAAAGTAIAMGTADVDAVLPAGSRMVIRLDAPIQVEKTVG